MNDSNKATMICDPTEIEFQHFLFKQNTQYVQGRDKKIVFKLNVSKQKSNRVGIKAW